MSEGTAAGTWVGTSWKMNKTLADALGFVAELQRFLPRCDPAIQPFVVPPFTALREVAQALGSDRVRVGAQTMHWADHGPWTGEVSPLMVRDCGADLVELGHSERRHHFGETDRTVGLKVAAAVHHDLTPLVCLGETLAQRQAGCTEAVLRTQTAAALSGLRGADGEVTVLFAYEPVWAIGDGGVPATADYADRQHRLIKEVAGSILGAAPPVLYGGSVNPDNCVELLTQPSIDGLFVGRSAWTAAGYVELLRLASTALRTGSEPRTERSNR